jgi:hypothetical protein
MVLLPIYAVTCVAEVTDVDAAISKEVNVLISYRKTVISNSNCQVKKGIKGA